MNLFGAVQLGGNKTDVAATGSSAHGLADRFGIPKTTPESVLASVCSRLARDPVECIDVAGTIGDSWEPIQDLIFCT